MTLGMLVPSGLGLLVGSGIRVAPSAHGSFRCAVGPPVRLLPRTTRDLMVAVACIGLGLACIHRMMVPQTIYAPGYDERKFRAIREGMTSKQVESALGSPLHKISSSEDGNENWMYSTQYTSTSDYQRRWILMKNGRVERVICDYWED